MVQMRRLVLEMVDLYKLENGTKFPDADEDSKNRPLAVGDVLRQLLQLLLLDTLIFQHGSYVLQTENGIQRFLRNEVSALDVLAAQNLDFIPESIHID